MQLSKLSVQQVCETLAKYPMLNVNRIHLFLEKESLNGFVLMYCALDELRTVR